MLFDISELDPRGVGLDCTVEVPRFKGSGGDDIACDPARLVGHLGPTQRGIELSGRFETVAHLECARCLGGFELPLSEKFRLFLRPPAEDEGEPEYEEIPEDDPDAVDLYPLEGHVVDLGSVLQEQIELALPYRYLCREDCRGLCGGCGADLNNEPCRCASADQDERFSGLEQFKRLLEQKRGEDPSRGR